MQNPRYLRYMLTLAEHKHFAKASRVLGVTQPALSQGIKKLEQELGARLFDRSNGTVELTPFGVAAMRHARPILDAQEELRRDVSLLKGLKTGTLVVAAGTFPADISGHRAIGRLVQHHPGIRCYLELREWHEIVALLLARTADLALAETSVAESEPSLVAEVINTHTGVFFCRAGHPVLRKRSPTLDDISGYPWALVTLPPRMGKGLAALRPEAGSMDLTTQRFTPAIRVETVAGARQIVRESDAISAAPAALIAGELERRELVAIRFSAPWLRLNYGFIYLRDRTLSPAARAFMDEVRKVEASLEW